MDKHLNKSRNLCTSVQRGRPAIQCLDDVEEWTGLGSNEMWRQPENRVACKKRISRVAPKDSIVYCIQNSKFKKQMTRNNNY